MKIKKQKNKLILLQILKAYYKKKLINFENNLNQIKIHLNQISNIVYKYHITDRKILLLGFPNSFIETIENTKHILIPEFSWFNGMLNNRINEKDNLPFNTFKLIRKLKKKVDLIIIANFPEKTTAITESYISRIPVITMNKKLNILKLKTTHNSVGNYSIISDKMEPNNIFFSLIKTTLNKAKKSKKVKIYKNLKTLKQNYNKKTRPYKKFKSFKNK